ncbi:MAG: hypothetical protein JSV79_10370 [Armatimonadota bacterium]|nr:MAG: hypothetical protein JSV79_10370 [Armatimonadota bacterium]
MLTAGIDLGSVCTKVAVLAGDELVGHAVAPTGHHPDATASQLLQQALTMAGKTPEDLSRVVSTGYGRRRASAARGTISEISANATGAAWLAANGVRTIIDIGGQDSKVISLDTRGRIDNFVMNDKCAAGTGRFLEVMAELLRVPLEEFGEASLHARDPVKIDNTCVVYAKSEVHSLLAHGAQKADIIAGLHRSIAQRVAVLARRVGVESPVLFDGGPARNRGLRRALEEELAVRLLVPEMPQIVTAIGAALIAQDPDAGRHPTQTGQGQQ